MLFRSFDPPDGVLQETIDPQSGQLASSACPQSVQEYFIAGSEPTQVCDLHGPHAATAQGGWLSHLFGKGGNPPASGGIQPNPPANANGTQPPGTQPADPAAEAETKKKKGLLDKVFGIFGSSKKPADTPKPQPQP